MIIKKIKIADWFYEIVVAVLLFILFFNLINSLGGKLNYLKTILGLFLWYHIITENKFTKNELLPLIIISSYILIFSVLGKGSFQLIIAEMPITIYFLKKKSLNKYIWTVLPIIIMAIVLMSWRVSPNHYYLFNGISRNYISIFGLLSLEIYNMMKEKEHSKINILLIVFFFFVCINAIGRGGIIASGIVLVLFVFTRFFKSLQKNMKSYVKLILFVVVIICILLLVKRNEIYIKTTYFGRFFGTESSAERSTEERKLMIVQYVNSCKNSLKDFFFGADAASYSSVANNLHNSYLQLHSKFGVVALIYLVFASGRSMIYMKKNCYSDSLILFVGVLVRAATDWMFPSFPIDVFVLYYMLLPIFSEKGNENNEQQQ